MNSITYGKWIDLPCVCQVDFDYYREEAKKLAALASDYMQMFMRSIEGRAMIESMPLPPNDPIPQVTNHRGIIEWLYRRADFVAQLEYRAGFDNTDGHIAAQIWNGQLLFIPPTIAAMREGKKQYAAH